MEEIPPTRTLHEVLDQARAAWPGVNLDEDVFATFVAERAAEHPLDALHTDELYLACACLRHDPAALALLETSFLAEVGAMVAHLRLPAATVEDLVQQLRSDLLVAAPGDAPKLASYAGHGSLEGWLRITAVRAGLKLVPRHEETDEDGAALASITPGPELAYLRRADQARFAAAFREALASLPPRDQNLLRQHHVDGLSIDLLGELYQAHRTSCARWLRQARETLFKRTKALLMKQNRATVSECESMIRAAQSQLEITFRSLLG